MKMLKRTWAEIDLDALRHNYEILTRNLPGGCRFLGVVKADAYGHGAVPIARELQELGAGYLAVSNYEEALQLRRNEITLPILILGYTPVEFAADEAALHITQEVHSLEYGKALSQALEGSGQNLTVHMKIDTGMSRLGQDRRNGRIPHRRRRYHSDGHWRHSRHRWQAPDGQA